MPLWRREAESYQCRYVIRRSPAAQLCVLRRKSGLESSLRRLRIRSAVDRCCVSTLRAAAVGWHALCRLPNQPTDIRTCIRAACLRVSGRWRFKSTEVQATALLRTGIRRTAPAVSSENVFGCGCVIACTASSTAPCDAGVQPGCRAVSSAAQRSGTTSHWQCAPGKVYETANRPRCGSATA